MIVFEQMSDVLEKAARLPHRGVRAGAGLSSVPGHPLMAGLGERQLRNCAGEADDASAAPGI